MGECLTCDWTARRDAGDAPPWDSIARTPGWDVVHATGTAVEGWLVLVARRHVAAVADLTDGEAAELGPLLTGVSRALHDVTGCQKTYVVQFAEHPRHRHVHVHLIPRAHDLPDDQRGPGIFSRLGVADDEVVPEARRDEIAVGVRARLVLPEPAA